MYSKIKLKNKKAQFNLEVNDYEIVYHLFIKLNFTKNKA